ncbi:MAG: serine--tRNA ligase, partial [Janibacter sp.]|nr:serine--tRNA ligase [Janibacter sp.]
MIDLKFLRDQPDAVRASQRARGEDESLVDAVIAADERRRTSIQAFEAARSEQKAASKELGPVMGRLGKLKKSDPDSADLPALEAQAAGLRDKGAAMSARVKELEAAADTAKAELDTSLRSIGNVIQEGVPAGGEEDFDLLEEVGTPRDFAAEGFAPKDHLELGELLGAIDMERGAKVSGSRFYYLKGAGAQLEMALMGLAQQIAAEEGFTPLVVPTLVRPETMAGTGYLDAHDDVYHLPADDLYLTGTSEVALAGFHADEILDLRDGPIRYVSTSTCFRREAGSYGKDTRGIFRVHQFQKTEMFVFCRPEDA